MSKPLSMEEAFIVLHTGSGFIAGAGYVLYKGGYFAYGTFPGCMRGGASIETLEEFHRFTVRETSTIQWELLSLQDIIERYGYWPEISTIFTVLTTSHLVTTQDQRSEAIGLERDMLQFMIDGPYKTEDFKDGFAHVRIW